MTRAIRFVNVAMVVVLLLGAAVVGCSRPSEPAVPGTSAGQEKAASAKDAIEMGLRFLRTRQAQDGAYRSGEANLPIDIGITGLVVKAMASSPRAYREADGPFVSRAVEFLLAHQESDGGIRGKMLGNYTTAIAVVALEALDNPKHADTIARALTFLKGQQCNAAAGYEPDKHPGFGGFGYGGSMRPDLSNTQMALDAFEAAGLSKDDPAYADVVIFLARCQNNSETNDQAFAGTDGGAAYSPTESKADAITKPDGTKGLRSYGSMTYALLKSMLYANLSKDDPRVTAAIGWIKEHYTLQENPGLNKKSLYYYYHTFAKALAAYGEDVITDSSGKPHDWRKDLTAKLIELQRPDGSWLNEDSDRYNENNPVLVTCYAVLALEETVPK